MHRSLYLLALPIALGACPKEQALSASEAHESLEEASASSQAENLLSANVELSTHFTLGAATEQAAAELRAFVASQLPCAELDSDGSTLTIEYGVNPGNCRYNGHEFSGSSSITITKSAASDVLVEHRWTGLSNGVVELNGSARVTWSAANGTRHVEHDVEWKQLASGRTGSGKGDRVQAALASGIAEGIQVDGSRSWTGARGTWDLGIDGVQMRWADPVPQAGSYTLSTPFGKTVTMSFSRVDADTIRVLVTGPRRDFQFTVSRAGAIADR